ncbi:MAG: asparaginase [Actinomycetes bacterium]
MPVVAEVLRSGFVEAVHCGAVLARDGAGETVVAVGDVAGPVFPRSCNKPLQAAAMVRAGLDISDRQLALVAASHSGTPVHVELARVILHSAQLDESALVNTPGLPLDETAMRDLLASGGGPDSIHQNCSGKHAGMVATCIQNGWPVPSYCEPTHPLQRLIADTIEELAGENVSHVGVDGCGAPLFALSLNGLSRAFAVLSTSAVGTPEHRVANAMRKHPDAVGGPQRAVTRLMSGIPGLVAKDGAEGAFAAALPDGATAVVKIADGAGRAAVPVVVSALRALGVEAAVLDELATAPVLGGGHPVGEVRAIRGLCEREHIN